MTVPSQLVTDSDYVDFNKMYTKVMLQSQIFAEKSEYHTNSAKIEVSKLGVYLVHNSASL